LIPSFLKMVFEFDKSNQHKERKEKKKSNRVRLFDGRSQNKFFGEGQNN